MKKILLIIIAVLVVLLAGTGYATYYFYNKYAVAQRLLANPTEAAKIETKTIVDEVGKLIALPNEEVSIATIMDKEKLKDQPFFQAAENGDKVLIYAQAKKAILYRPSNNKVIDVAPLVIGDQNAQPGASGMSPAPIIPTPKAVMPTPESSPKASATPEASPKL